MTAALTYIINAVSQIVLFILLLRFWMPWFRSEFHNPVAQGILKITAPLVVPLRRILPSIGRVDTATVVAAFAIQFLTFIVTFFINGFVINIAEFYLQIAWSSLLMLAIHSCGLFMLVIFVAILLGWFAPHVQNPVTEMVHSMAEPLLRPFRKIVPSLGGFDVSPVIPLILLGALRVLIGTWQPLGL